MVLAIVIIALVIAGSHDSRQRRFSTVKNQRYNKRIQAYADTLNEKVLNKKSLKAYKKNQKQELKKFQSDDEIQNRKRFFVMHFNEWMLKTYNKRIA